MNIVLKVIIFAALLFVAFLIFDLNKLDEAEQRIVGLPIVLGTASLVFAYDMTGSGFYAKYHYVDTGTPGCVWIALGVICWVFAIWFYCAEVG